MLIRGRTESQINELVARVLDGGRCESDTIECKRQLETYKAAHARQIAGLLNSARGRPAMWIIGLDEDAHQLGSPAEEPDLAEWWSQVRKRFSGLDVEMQSDRVHTDRGIVTVLYFDTSKPPYMVTTDGHGGVNLEVPWREGTALKTATRAQLLSLLVDAGAVPEIELISPILTAAKVSDERTVLRLTADLYFYTTVPAVLPKHRWRLHALATGEWPDRDAASMEMTMYPHPRKQATFGWQTIGALDSNIPADQFYEPAHPQGVIPRESGLIVNGSDSVHLVATADLNPNQLRTVHHAASFALTFRMPLDHGDRAATHQVILQHVNNPRDADRGEIGRWAARTSRTPGRAE